MTDSKHPWQASLPALYHRAAHDAEFRSLCLRDARAAIQQLGDFEISVDLKLRFVEKVDELVIPLPPLAGDHLNLDELDAVAGGAVNVGTGYTSASTVYVPYGMGGYPYGGGGVWPPVDPNTPSGLPPMVKPGGAPPGYDSI